MTVERVHTTVLLSEAIDALVGAGWPASAAPVLVDGTFGRGGHSRLLLQRLPAQARLLVYDKDPQALAQARALADARLEIYHDSFARVADLPAGSVDGLLLDLGVSSPQLDDPERGFSFRSDGPLDMRMDPTRGQSAAQWLAQAGVQQLTEVIREYGEERFAGSIAKAIVARRQAHGPLTRTRELAQLVADAVKTREPGKDPATRTFQAIRIYINGELDELRQTLAASLRVLRAGGRLVVISFHSLEDRLVKQFVVRHSRAAFDRAAPFAEPAPTLLRDLGRVMPSAAEVAANARARSAVMRVAQRTEAPLPQGVSCCV
ncbi:MAG: 16S rRNA (cytosine(1402)-N(4))-methyltransferase RsmH [Rhodoferax sp.]